MKYTSQCVGGVFFDCESSETLHALKHPSVCALCPHKTMTDVQKYRWVVKDVVRVMCELLALSRTHARNASLVRVCKIPVCALTVKNALRGVARFVYKDQPVVCVFERDTSTTQRFECAHVNIVTVYIENAKVDQLSFEQIAPYVRAA